MAYTAEELFTDWYNSGTNTNATAEELSTRKQAFAEILPNDNISFWLQVLKIYLGLLKDGEDYKEFQSFFRKFDDNFSLQKNHLTRLLAGCIIAQKIEKNDTYISDSLALGLISTKVLQDFEEIIPDIHTMAESFWLEIAEQDKEIDLDFDDAEKIKLTTGKIEIPADPSTAIGEITKYVNSLKKDCTSSADTINNICDSLGQIKRNFSTLSQETDVLWYLFTGYSSSLKKSFRSLSPELLAVIVAIELDKITIGLGGIGKLDSIVLKAFESVDSKGSSSLDNIIPSVKGFDSVIKELIPSVTDENGSICPLLYCLNSYVDYPEANWQSIVNAKVKIDTKKELSLLTFSTQLYYELMLIKCIKEASHD